MAVVFCDSGGPAYGVDELFAAFLVPVVKAAPPRVVGEIFRGRDILPYLALVYTGEYRCDYLCRLLAEIFGEIFRVEVFCGGPVMRTVGEMGECLEVVLVFPCPPLSLPEKVSCPYRQVLPAHRRLWRTMRPPGSR